MLKILKSLVITLLLIIAVGVGFYVTNQQNHAYAVDGACFWKDGGRVQCKYKNWATSSISFFANLPDAVSLTPSDLPIVGGAFSKFDPVEWDKQLGDAVNGNCLVSDCDDYIFRPDLSAKAGYPIYDSDTKSSSGNSNGKYLHFVSNNPLYGFLTNSPDKISPVPQKDNNKWIPIGNTSNALKGDPDDNCSLRKTNNCKIRDSINYSSTAPYDSGAFLQTVRNIVALERLKQQCEKEAPLSFVTCPIYEAIVDGISNLIGGQGVSGERQGLIIDFLTITPLEAKAGQQPVFQQIVGNVVTVANIFYVIIFLLLIFSSSLPFGLDNYTIKKTLPKFIGAVIMTQFAYLICGVIIDFFNLLGTIVPNLIFSLQAVKDVVPSGGGSDAVSAGLAATIVVGGAGATALLASVGWILLIILAFIAIIAILVGFVYMVLRYLVLYILILLAPIAFASWVLPGTEKFFKSWWKNFIRLNAMFPMITGMLAVAILISRVLVANPAGGVSGGALSLIAMIIPIVALLAIPRTLKWTTDGMNAIAGKMLGATSGKIGAGGAAVGKGAKSATQKSKEAAKNAANDYRQQKSVEQFGKGNKQVAALLGGNLPSKKGLLKTARQSEAYIQERNKNNRASLKYAGAGLDYEAYGQELIKVARGDGSTALGVKAGDASMQVAAISEMAGRGDWGDLRSQVYNNVGEQTFSQGLEPHIGDAATKAPDLVKRDRGAAFDAISADKIAQLDKSTLVEYANHVASSGANSAAHLNLRRSALLINADPRLAASIDPTAKQHLNSAVFPGTNTPILNTKIR